MKNNKIVNPFDVEIRDITIIHHWMLFWRYYPARTPSSNR